MHALSKLSKTGKLSCYSLFRNPSFLGNFPAFTLSKLTPQLASQARSQREAEEALSSSVEQGKDPETISRSTELGAEPCK